MVIKPHQLYHKGKATSLDSNCDRQGNLHRRDVEKIGHDSTQARHRLRTILGISCWDHAANEDTKRMAGMERLPGIVTTRRWKMVGRILRLQRERPVDTAKYLVPEAGRGKRRGRRMHGEVLSKKTWKRWVSSGMAPAGSPVTEIDGGFS